ncbi:shikimate dehydrogenase [Candidatus Pantoea edessiphila]|uniref:Shikimate dehydrogenase (NADP(+)) n=1 Tax=Candidatus Pantoea edessiphila TaxID=2044610 RepID=A0A2P5SY00_9GAMM|nr:shikimate dehydrogenase [Candidatus Pantoea edessiphila]MBK4775903.1 shikimate dehydrogenase [Pantoea sp. Edef]PPI87204.1 shikimate dehydrogenase [Candidatus Pantoea edessiphila]
MFKFAVFGNPIYHSKSPIVHYEFSKQTGIQHTYGSICAPKDGFLESISKFFSEGGLGANITLPFKQQAYEFADELSERAYLAGAVNTLKRQSNNKIFGDNTDGIGLLSDLKRLKMIREQKKILIIGAGGAARGIIGPLLLLGNIITVTNRTKNRALELVDNFRKKGVINTCNQEELENNNFDLIINATASSSKGQMLAIPNSLIHNKSCCYDMYYQKKLTPFLYWCKKQGCSCLADGLGMLIYQAAYAFQLWHGVMPKINNIIKNMRSDIRL